MNFSIKHNPLAIQILSASIAACTIIVATMEQANLFPQEEWISRDQLPQLQQLIPKCGRQHSSIPTVVNTTATVTALCEGHHYTTLCE